VIGVIGVNPPTPIAMKQSDEQSRQHAHRRHQIVVHVPNSSRIRLIVYGLVIFTDVKACQNPLKLRVVATRAHTCNRTRESVGKCQSRKQRSEPTTTSIQQSAVPSVQVSKIFPPHKHTLSVERKLFFSHHRERPRTQHRQRHTTVASVESIVS